MIWRPLIRLLLKKLLVGIHGWWPMEVHLNESGNARKGMFLRHLVIIERSEVPHARIVQAGSFCLGLTICSPSILILPRRPKGGIRARLHRIAIKVLNGYALKGILSRLLVIAVLDPIKPAAPIAAINAFGSGSMIYLQVFLL